MDEQNVNVVSNESGLQPELIQDESLLKEDGRISLKAFKNWSWNLVWKNKYG